ncbi:MAG: protein phosphatase [Candidatus Dormibacteraeota bacterium]|nr:protein phosphatase [Candidatus Dormibacteraeota bacterium]
MTGTWDTAAAGILRLPSGRLVRGRGLRWPLPSGPTPDFAVYMQSVEPARVPWEMRWVCWPDFLLPTDPIDARDAFEQAWRRTESERVELVCWSGRGRTGTALACVAVLDGVPGDQAVAYVRQYYDARAAETPWQRRYVSSFSVG